MGAIDDTRKLLQDLITPDIKALEARMVAHEKSMDLRFKHVDEKFEQLEQKMDLKFDVVAANLAAIAATAAANATVASANHAELLRQLDTAHRLEKLESDNFDRKQLDRPA